jgi:hypothetical protein
VPLPKDRPEVLVVSGRFGLADVCHPAFTRPHVERSVDVFRCSERF